MIAEKALKLNSALTLFFLPAVRNISLTASICRGNCNKYIENELTLYLLLNIIITERTRFCGAMFWPLYSGGHLDCSHLRKKITWKAIARDGMTFITRLLH